MTLRFALPLACLILANNIPSTTAQDTSVTAVDQNVFVMGGPFSTGYFGDTLAFWNVDYEDNFFLGVGYQYFFYHNPHQGLKLGVEAGLGGRFGDASSGEVWAGGVLRYDGLTVGDFTISPALTAGFSLVTDLIGAEARRAEENGVTAPFLFYLGPEISVSHASMPNLELLGRVQHRSGGFGTITNLDGSNAAVLGLRYKF